MIYFILHEEQPPIKTASFSKIKLNLGIWIISNSNILHNYVDKFHITKNSRLKHRNEIIYSISLRIVFLKQLFFIDFKF